MKIYGIHIGAVAGISGDSLMQLMPERYARARRYIRMEDRLRCIAAGLLVQNVLGISESELRCGEFGKPYAPGREAFSLSHGGDWAVLARDREEVGVDIEPMNAANLDVAKRVFTAGEIEWMRADALVRFHALWTVKESIMKGTGLGMQLDPAEFEVLPMGSSRCISGKEWHTAWTLHDGCALACAARHEIAGIEFEDISGNISGI